ncbi:MAG: COX15/CtaA family protein [Hyphomicrobiaceae bacterium]|nr:COX15/CtaA family protein [Hyphomicrobiaceae bacterium]
MSAATDLETGIDGQRGKGGDAYRPVRLWLYCVAVLVVLMVLVGGATRLTDSGLSITEWKPVTGIVPPLGHEAWLTEFEKYQAIPEYQLQNRGMSLAEFQFIYWWEWGHRFLGRIIGFVFLIPLIVFAVRRRLPPGFGKPLAGLFLLGGLQGAIGWWMVASGLVDRVDVSQYRLAIHLTMAVSIFAALLYVADGMKPRPEQSPHASRESRTLSLVLFFGAFVQLFLGGLVAGLDAGLSYTTWPLMDGQLIPSARQLFAIDPWYANFGENPMTVQFVHRIGAYTLLALALIAAFVAARRKEAQAGSARRLVVDVLIQAAIGITALTLQVPLWAGLLHQAGALVVIAGVLRHGLATGAIKRLTPARVAPAGA